MKASKLNKRLQKLFLKADKRNHGSESLKSDVFILSNDVHNLNDKIYNTIGTLNHYGTNDHHINLPIALKEANRLLEAIEMNANHRDNVKNILKTTQKSLYFWSNTSEILAQQVLEVNALKYDAGKLLHRINDAQHNVYKTNNILDAAINVQETNLQNFKIFADKEHEIKTLKMDIVQLYNNSIVSSADELIEEIDDNNRKIAQDLTSLIELKEIIDGVNQECSSELKNIKSNWLTEAQDHAKDLILRAEEYSQNFQNTKNGAEVALLAR